MATFLPGVTDEFGAQDLYTPDYTFLTKAVGQRQMQYDRGFNAWKNILNSTLNSELTNTDNISRRNEIFKKITQSIKDVSTLDLSNPANVSNAMSVLEPITSDREIAYDTAITQKNKKVASLLESIKSSFDPKIRDTYNKYSEMDVQLQSEKLKNAKRGDGSIFQIQPGEFVPYENPAEMLNKAAKDAGIDIEITQSMGNGYLQTIKNGKIAVDPFTKWAINTMGNKYDRYFQQMGRVQAESTVRNIMSEQGISRQEAQNMIAVDLTKQLVNEASQRGMYADSKIKEYDQKIKLFQDTASKNGNKALDSNEYKKLLSDRENYVNEYAESNTDLEKINAEGPDYVVKNLANIISNKAKKGSANEWALGYAMSKGSVDLKADEVVLTKWRMALQESQFQRSMAFKEKDLAFRMENAAIKNQLEYEKAVAEGKIASTEYIGQVDGTGLPGVDQLASASEETKQDMYNNTFGAQNGLMTLVYQGEDFNRMSGTINKIRMGIKTKKNMLNNSDIANLNQMMKDFNIGTFNYNPNSTASSELLLNKLVSGIYKSSKDNLNVYVKAGGGKNGQQLKAKIEAFNNVRSNMTTLLQRQSEIDKVQDQLADLVSAGGGKIKDLFEGATIVGRTRSGKFIYNFDNVSPEAKQYLGNIVTKQFQNTAVTSTQYKYNKLSAAELINIIRSQSDNPELAEKLLNISDETAIKAFSGDALATFNPVTKKVTFSLKPDTTSDEAKSIFGKNVAAQTYNFTMTYDEANLINSSRLKNNMYANTLDNRSLGIANKLYKNANGRISSPSYFENVGYHYDIVSTANERGQAGLNVTIKKKDHSTNKWIKAESFFYPVDINDKNNLLKLESKINDNFLTYINQLEQYTKYVVDDDATMPIDYND
jgi:hypothetical protein